MSLCKSFVLSSSRLFLVGDFNIDFSVPCTCLYRKLFSVISSFNLTQVVSEPTRVSKSSSSLIDLIFVSSVVSVLSCTTVPPLANGDHYGLQLLFTMPFHSYQVKRFTRKVWQYALADFDRANELLDTIDWDSLLPQDDVNTYWAAWKMYFFKSWRFVYPVERSKLEGTFHG